MPGMRTCWIVVAGLGVLLSGCDNFRFTADLATEAAASGALNGDGSIGLDFGGAVASGCGDWVNQAGTPSAPNCVALIRSEERFGDGDHVFDLDEQHRASTALYNTVRGTHTFTGIPRRVRLGLELNF